MQRSWGKIRFSLLEEQLLPCSWKGVKEDLRAGRAQGRGQALWATWRTWASPPTHPPKVVGALQGWLEAEKGCDLTQVLPGALWWLMWGGQTGVWVGARELGQTSLCHPPNSPRSWRLSLSSVYR